MPGSSVDHSSTSPFATLRLALGWSRPQASSLRTLTLVCLAALGLLAGACSSSGEESSGRESTDPDAVDPDAVDPDDTAGTDATDSTGTEDPDDSGAAPSTPVPTSAAPQGPIELPGGAQQMASADGQTFWVTIDNGTEGSLAVVEGSPLAYTDLIPIGFQPRGVAVADDGGIWVVDRGSVAAPSFDGGRVHRIDPEAREITATYPVTGSNPEGVVVVGDEVWVGTEEAAVAINTQSGEPTPVQMPDTIDGATELSSGDGSIWAVDSYFARRVTRIDPVAKSIAGAVEIQDSQTTDVAQAGNSIWVTDRGQTDVDRSNRLLHRIDAAAGSVADTIDIGFQGAALAADEQRVYVAANDNTAAPTASALVVVDAATAEVLRTDPIDVPAIDVLITPGVVWVLNGAKLTPFPAS